MRMGVGGEGGIRTHGEISPTHAFQACSFSHSDTSPREACALADGIGGDDRPLPGPSQRGASRTVCPKGPPCAIFSSHRDESMRSGVASNNCQKPRRDKSMTRSKSRRFAAVLLVAAAMYALAA